MFRVVAITLVPLFLLGALELALRVAGYGYPTSFFLRLDLDSNEATEGTPALPPDRMLRGIRQPECATNADPHVPLGLRLLSSSHVAPDVRISQVVEQLHE